MSRGKHRLAPPPRRLTPRSTPRLALVAAPLATVAVVAGGLVLTASADVADRAPKDATTASNAFSGSSAAASLSAPALGAVAVRSAGISRSLDRLALPQRAGTKWSTADLNEWPAPQEKGQPLGVIPARKKIAVTGDTSHGFSQVIVEGHVRWVHSAYLADKRPPKVVEPAQMGLADQPCAGTSSVENGLVPDAVQVYRAVCNNFPQITSYGGYDPHGEHSSGKAIDIMTSDVSLGYQIAEFLQAHAAELNLYDIIWRQHIWTPVRASEGWRSMPDRGSTTANHYDHVHVSVN